MQRRLVLVAALALLALPLVRRPGDAAEPDHLLWARRLVAGVTPETNVYASRPTVVTWAGVNGGAETRNRSVCSALVAHLLMQAYGYRAADFESWLGGRFPRAAGFHLVIGRLSHQVKPTGHPGHVDSGAEDESGDDDAAPGASE
jgi:hypothetical protein